MKRARDLRADALRCAGDERGFLFKSMVMFMRGIC